MDLVQIEALDRRVLGGIADAMDEAVRRGGAWIACRPGCASCCLGPFEITALDAWRIRRGLALADPAVAARITARAAAYAEGDDEPCPGLDPQSLCCDLYEWRPATCRVFGPAVRSEGGIGACELCYDGATDEEIDACAVALDPWEEDLPGELSTVATAIRSGTSGDGSAYNIEE